MSGPTFNAAHPPAGTSDTVPAHSVGDILAQFAFRNGAATLPGAGTNYTTRQSLTGNTAAFRDSVNIAAATSGEGATYSSASDVVTAIITPGAVWGWGNNANGTGSSTTITYPALPSF